MPGLSFYDKQHIQKIAAQQAVIANIFNQFILSVSPYLHKWSDAGKNNVWIHNQRIESAVDRELLNLESMLYANISAFQKDGWERAERKNDDFISQFIKGMSISSATKDGMFAHSLSAFEALKNDIDANGFKLSDRVWNITQQTKSQLEFYLDSGVVAGRNANGISSDIRQILQNPQKRFRRIRNEKGELVLSQPMKNYHPGQGVYRSAYKNALRTSATTTNIAYRSADYERWSKQNFILGIEIHRSSNNRGPCRICDAMVGRYPKTFKFTGFHPFCICFATPITMEPEDFADFLLNDTVPQGQTITDIPQAAKDFVAKNKNELQSTFWYKDNFLENETSEEKEGHVRQKTEKQENVVKPKNETFDIYPTNNGNVRISSLHGKNEKEENLKVASYLANKYGYEIALIANPDNKKSADSFNKTLNVAQEYKMNMTATKSSIDNLLRSAARQADNVVLWIESDISLNELSTAIHSRVKRSKIKSVTIVRGNKDKTYHRDEIIQNDFKIQQADLICSNLPEVGCKPFRVNTETNIRFFLITNKFSEVSILWKNYIGLYFNRKSL